MEQANYVAHGNKRLQSNIKQTSLQADIKEKYLIKADICQGFRLIVDCWLVIANPGHNNWTTDQLSTIVNNCHQQLRTIFILKIGGLVADSWWLDTTFSVVYVTKTVVADKWCIESNTF